MSGVFTWKPTWNSAVNKAPRVQSMSFGDGYKVVSADGINTNLEQWDLVFDVKTDTESDAIMDFLDSQEGWMIFDWVNPRGRTLRVRCGDYKRGYSAYNANAISARFEETPDL